MHVAGIGPDPNDIHGGHFPYQDMGPDQARAPYEILRRHSSTESGWFLLWDGDYHGGTVLPESSKVRDGFDMSWYAFRGPLWAWRGFWSLENQQIEAVIAYADDPLRGETRPEGPGTESVPAPG
jgi:hypothetical protein